MTTDEELVGLYTLITDALSDGPPSWKRDPVDNGKLEFKFEACGTEPQAFFEHIAPQAGYSPEVIAEVVASMVAGRMAEAEVAEAILKLQTACERDPTFRGLSERLADLVALQELYLKLGAEPAILGDVIDAILPRCLEG